MKGSVASGLLVDKSPEPYLNLSGDEVATVAKAVNSISTKERDAAQTAIQYALKNPALTSVIVGIRTMDQLEDAVRT